MSHKVCPKCTAMYDDDVLVCDLCDPPQPLRPATEQEEKDFEEFA